MWGGSNGSRSRYWRGQYRHQGRQMVGGREVRHQGYQVVGAGSKGQDVGGVRGGGQAA